MAYPQYNGANVPIFTGPPSWDSGVTLGVAYRTSLFEALDTSEERHSLYPRPLYRIRYRTLTLSANETAYLRKVIELAKGVPIGVPLWPMRTKLTADASAGATALEVDDVGRRLWDVFYTYALIWRDYKTWEVIDMAGALGTEIALDAATAGSWVTGDTVVPLLFGYLGRESFNALTDEHSQIEVSCEERFHGVHGQDVPESNNMLCNIIGFADGGGSTFDCHLSGVPLNDKGGGTYFNGNWVDSNLYLGLQDYDSYDEYVTGAELNGAVHGSVWDGAWVDSLQYSGLLINDSMDSYASGVSMSAAAGGSGFAAAWVDDELG